MCNVEKVKLEIEKYCRNMIRDVADSADILCTRVHKILQERLAMKKLCSKLVFKVLTPKKKKERVFIAKTFLNDCEADLTLLGQIIMGDELWVFEYDPSTKRQSMQWKRSDEPRAQKSSHDGCHIEKLSTLLSILKRSGN